MAFAFDPVVSERIHMALTEVGYGDAYDPVTGDMTDWSVPPSVIYQAARIAGRTSLDFDGWVAERTTPPSARYASWRAYFQQHGVTS